MSDARLPQRVYTEKEMTAILRRASEMQGRPAYGGEGLTLSEIQSVATEAGIDADLVVKAARLLDEHQDPDKDTIEPGFLGEPTTYRAERVITGRVAREDLPMLLRTVRRMTGKQGNLIDVLDVLEWRNEKSGNSTHVTVTPRPDRTRIEVLADRGETAGLILIFTEIGSLLAALTFGLALGAGEITVAVVGGGLVAGFLAARAWWRFVARRWRGRIDLLLDRLASDAEELVAVKTVTPRTLPES